MDERLADETMVDMVNHLKEYGACEWIKGTRCLLPGYLAGAALRLEDIRAMHVRQQNGRSP